MKFFEVGGCVRDEIMGIESNDIDFTVVLEDSDFPAPGTTVASMSPFEVMEARLVAMGMKIFVSTPEHLTSRAQFPKGQRAVFGESGPLLGQGYRAGQTFDFVLARREGTYSDGRRPDHVEPGTLEDDLRRRDFTMNAIAKDADGTLIDPFFGQQDIADGVIRAVGDPHDRLSEDALRAVRALRFAVTKGFRIEPSLRFAMESMDILDKVIHTISDDRKRAEVDKMFAHNTFASILVMNEFPRLTGAIFSGSVSLTATMKERKTR